MEGGSADHAGAFIGPSIHGGHALLLRIHAPAGYRPSMDIKKPSRLTRFLGFYHFMMLVCRIHKQSIAFYYLGDPSNNGKSRYQDQLASHLPCC